MTSTEPASFDYKSFIKRLPHKPGVYLMQDARKTVLYVGKAKNLQHRVSQYFQKNVSLKTKQLVSQIQQIEVTLTQTETEALLLEINLIKRYKPRYNVIFRDDKSYPFLMVSTQDPYPRLALHRGARHKQGQYYGPYPSGLAAKEALNQLQKLFKVRSCEDSYFRNRTRPCLLHQIQRCSAPCVKLIEQKQYAEDIKHVDLFLRGKSREVMETLQSRMQQASKDQQYEQAAMLRDQIKRLNAISSQQIIAHHVPADIDAFVTGPDAFAYIHEPVVYAPDPF